MSSAYTFRLAAVLRLRRAELEQAELTLSRANATLSRLITERNEVLAHCKSLDVAPPEQNGIDFSAKRAELSRTAAAVLELDAKVNVAAADAALAHIRWSSAHKRVGMLERLDENRRSEWRQENTRREANELDELATAAFVRDQLDQKVAL